MFKSTASSNFSCASAMCSWASNLATFLACATPLLVHSYRLKPRASLWSNLVQVPKKRSSAKMLTLSEDGEALGVSEGFLKTLQVCNPACKEYKILLRKKCCSQCVVAIKLMPSVLKTSAFSFRNKNYSQLNVLRSVDWRAPFPSSGLVSLMQGSWLLAQLCPLPDHPQPTSA